MLPAMKLLLDAFWRAAAYSLMPRVIGLSLLPLLLAGSLFLVLGYFFWEGAVAAVHGWLQAWSLSEAALRWLDVHASGGFRAVLAPMIVVALTVPVTVLVSLLLVAWLMTPALTRLVAERRFPALERRHGGTLWQSVALSLGSSVLALAAMLLSAPLWLVPPLALLVPPLIWGALTAKVMSFDALAEHADAAERRALLREHRWPLLLIGVASGYLGAAPSLLWALSAATLIFAPVLIALSVWLYTLVFAFSSLWFVHYALAALHARRGSPAAGEVVAPEPPRMEVIQP